MNLRLPTSGEPETSWYHGAYVFPPRAGKWRNVVYPDLNCFTRDHDVVTPSGIRRIDELDVGDDVYSLNPHTLNVEVTGVSDVHHYPDYDGRLEHIETDRCDFLVTPNHRLFTKHRGMDDYEFVQAQHLIDNMRYTFVDEWGGEDGGGIETVDVTEFLNSDEYHVCAEYDCHGHHFRSQLPDGCEKVRANYHKGFFFDGGTFEEYRESIESLASSTSITHPNGAGSVFRQYTFDGNDFVEFIGWFITEGSVYWPDDSNSASVQIAQKTDEHRERILSLLTDMGFDPSISTNGFTIGSSLYGTILDRLCGHGSANKTIPNFIFERASVEQKRLLFETMMDGDGSGKIYYTNSDELKEDFVRLCVEIGVKPRVGKRRGTWEISVTNNNDGFRTDTNVSSVNGRGYGGVYCVTLEDNNTLMAGRNGTFQWIGQSLYPHMIRQLNASPETLVGDEDALEQSQWTVDDCVWGYYDPRDVKRCKTHEPWGEYRDPSRYKAVRWKNSSGEWTTKWVSDPRYKTLYFLAPSVREGFVASTIADFLELKEQYRGTEKYEAVKRIINSAYGVLGYATDNNAFRLFDWRLAEAVTLCGRMVIQHTAEEFERYVNEDEGVDATVVFGDTDSCAAAITGVDRRDEALSVSNRAVDHVNGEYPSFVSEEFGCDENFMELELESYSPSAYVHHKKKRYATWITVEDGDEIDEIDTESIYYNTADESKKAVGECNIKGFEYTRSDTSTLTKETQRFVLETILKEPLSEAKPRVYEHLRERIENVRDGDVPFADIGIVSGIRKPLDEYGSVDSTPWPQYRGAKYANQHIDGEHISEGSKVLYYPVTDVHGLPRTYDAETAEDGDVVDYVAVEDPRHLEGAVAVDYEEVIAKQLRGPLENILENVGWAWDEVVSGTEQTAMEAFM